MLSYFTDPVLRAPTVGCMLMCLSASMMGVLVFLQKRSLLGEALSHAAYPGIVLGMVLTAVFALQSVGLSMLFVLGGALGMSMAGLWSINWLEKRGKIKSDAALCFMLSSFFGVGILGASWLQGSYPSMAKEVQLYLFGQAATMTDIHIAIYGVLSSLVVFFLILGYRPLQALHFDRDFALSAAIAPRYLGAATFALLLFSVVIGIRSVGVVLMSGMLIAPAVAARQWTNQLSTMLWLSGLFGAMSGLLGNVLSVEASIYLSASFPEQRLSLPTGPMIILIGTGFALFSLLFAPNRGSVSRLVRIFRFRIRCVEENIIKAIWKQDELLLTQLKEANHLAFPLLIALLWRMRRHGWIARGAQGIVLTTDGERRACRIVRLHRLWEVYLAELGWPNDQVHRTAEEMEHILTSELEERLSILLNDPKVDPHEQPIPEKIR